MLRPFLHDGGFLAALLVADFLSFLVQIKPALLVMHAAKEVFAPHCIRRNSMDMGVPEFILQGRVP